jgi:hypothetical protein
LSYRVVCISLAAMLVPVLFVAAVGCGGKSDAIDIVVTQNTQDNGSSTLVSEPLSEEYKENPALIAADIYANHYGVSREEALHWFDIADAFRCMESILEGNEPETFAGLWIQHEPVYCIAIAFTRDGEETMKKYVAENLTRYVQVRTVKYSFQELENAQLQVMSALNRLGILFDGAIYVQYNYVEFNVTNRTEIDNAIEEGRLILPECVRINVVTGLAALE